MDTHKKHGKKLSKTKGLLEYKKYSLRGLDTWAGFVMADARRDARVLFCCAGLFVTPFVAARVLGNFLIGQLLDTSKRHLLVSDTQLRAFHRTLFTSPVGRASPRTL